ncbi:MAG: hypothetical protein P9F75_02640 [Candidatus Contendobacter sp.]|nr:hypothetical protein [Candidatus Contendobacter sp.]
MSARTIDQLLHDENIPLCFDTNAIFGSRAGPELLRKIRERFRARKLLIPAWVVAERSRQLKMQYGTRFNRSLIEGFLADPELELELLAFDRDVALSGWLDVVERFQDNEWRWEEQPTSKPRPCAERCRTGDHIVYALALAHRALLVTGDKPLLRQVAADGAYPGAIGVDRLRALLPDLPD